MQRAGHSSNSWVDRLLSWLYPSKCSLCDLLGDSPLCSICRDTFVTRAPLITRAYGPADLSFWGGVYQYEGRAAQAVQRLKYSRSTALATTMASLVAEAAKREGLDQMDAIVPVPIHWSRRCFRGFNQSELLCGAFPQHIVRPDLLRRVRATRPQVGLTQEERLRNLQGAFRTSGDDIKGKSILLLDDVLTSGQTARECAAVLKAAGAAEVGILAFAGSS